MKRLLLLNYEFPPVGGGASTFSFDLAEELSKEFFIDVITMSVSGKPKIESSGNITIYRVGLQRKTKFQTNYLQIILYLFWGLIKAFKLTRVNKYKICHCHFILPTGILAIILKKIRGLDFILIPHGSDVSGYNPVKTGALHKILSSISNKILKSAKEVVFGSNFLKNLSKHDGVVINQGMKRDKYSPQNKKSIIITSNRLVAHKRIIDLIESVKDIESEFKVHVVGDGPEKTQLMEKSKESKTEIIFNDWLDNTSKEYKNLLEQATVYVSTSLVENSSVSLIEAMQAGCAIVATDVGGNREVLGDAAIFVPAQNPIALEDALEYLISSPNKISRLQKASVDRSENFNIVDTTHEHKKLF